MTIEIIGSQPTLPNGIKVPLVPATRVGNLIFCSGALGVDENFKVVEGGIAEQTKQCLHNIQQVLSQVGASIESVAKVTVWLADVGDFAAFNQVYAEGFGSHFPARSTVISELALPGALVEIEVIAEIGDR